MTLEIDDTELGRKENPLDCVEDVLLANDWVFNRMGEDELMVQVKGRACDYRVFFIWQEEMNALQFCCQYDLTIEKKNYEMGSKVLMALNENLWMGHFDIPKDTGIPSFRHTCLFRGLDNSTTYEYIEDLVEISMTQCERHFPAFYLLSRSHYPDTQSLTLALMETKGES